MSRLLGWGAYVRDKNISARFCAKKGGGLMHEGRRICRTLRYITCALATVHCRANVICAYLFLHSRVIVVTSSLVHKSHLASIACTMCMYTHVPDLVCAFHTERNDCKE